MPTRRPALVRTLTAIAVAALAFATLGGPIAAANPVVSGTLSYLERIALTPDATAVVTIESVDMSNQQITYRTADDRKMVQKVSDVKLLDGLSSGDRIEVTLTRAKAVSIEK